MNKNIPRPRLAHWLRQGAWIGLFLLLAGCLPVEPPPASPTPAGGLPVSTEPATPAALLPSPTNAPSQVPTSTPVPEQILAVCLGSEPASLYPLAYIHPNGSITPGQPYPDALLILQAIFNGPYHSLSYDLQPVLLQAVPSLAGPDAEIHRVAVSLGDRVVDIYGTVVTLQVGTLIFPAGCAQESCAVEYPGPGENVEMDQLAVTFRIKPGISWSDGAPLTTADSVFAFQAALAAPPAEFPHLQGRLARTASYEALDSSAVRWVGLPGFRDPGYADQFWHPLPQHTLAGQALTTLHTLPQAARTPLGWGAYMVAEWAAGSHITLVRSPNDNQASPFFDRLVFRFTGTDPQQNLNALLQGECDVLAESTNPLAGSVLFRQAAASGQVVIVASPTTTWEHLTFGIQLADYENGWQPLDRPGFFDDPRTRQAIAYCLNRAGFASQYLGAAGEASNTYLASTHPLYAETAAAYPFNPEQGKALLEAAGWLDADSNPATPRVAAAGMARVPQGTPLELRYYIPQAGLRQAAAQFFAQNLQECGISVAVEALPDEVFYEVGAGGLVFGRQFDLAQFAWVNSQAPPCSLFTTRSTPGDDFSKYPYRWGGYNLSGYSSQAFDQACQAAESALPGQPEYEQFHIQAQEVFAADLPAIPLYWQIKWLVARPDLCGLSLNPTGWAWNWEKLALAPCP